MSVWSAWTKQSSVQDTLDTGLCKTANVVGWYCRRKQTERLCSMSREPPEAARGVCAKLRDLRAQASKECLGDAIGLQRDAAAVLSCAIGCVKLALHLSRNGVLTGFLKRLCLPVHFKYQAVGVRYFRANLCSSVLHITCRCTIGAMHAVSHNISRTAPSTSSKF